MSDWISVKDRLPDRSDYYWAWIVRGEPWGDELFFDAGRGRWLHEECGHEVSSVSHWMPLPDPPEDENAPT
jgi:hypothetical protein